MFWGGQDQRRHELGDEGEFDGQALMAHHHVHHLAQVGAVLLQDAVPALTVCKSHLEALVDRSLKDLEDRRLSLGQLGGTILQGFI